MHEFELSIVIPCLNEEKTLPLVIPKALASLKRLGINGEVIVADNGSSDHSCEVAQKLGARVVEVAHKGYGSALKGGMVAAKGKYILMGDADDSYNFEEIDDFVKEVRDGNDFVIGTRLKGKIMDGAMPFLHRYLGTPVLTFLLNLLFGTKISDCNCGMRCFTKAAFEQMKLTAPGMEFASEMMVKAGLLKLKIKEIPITLYRDKRDRKPHLRTWVDGWRHLKFMFLYSPDFLFLIPGGVLFLLGWVILLPLVPGPVSLFGRVFDYHTAILGGMCVILGYQTLANGISAKTFAQLQDFKVKDALVDKFYRWFTLERGISVGLLLIFLGGALGIFVFGEWVILGFANLRAGAAMTLASTLLVIGIQTVFSAFFLELLSSSKKNM